MPTATRSPVIVALDYDDPAAALAMAAQLDPARCRLKVGKELFTRAGPRLVERLVGAGHDVFLDLKFHDIPATVAGACAAAADLGVWMVNVHAGGGRAMLAAAREALERASSRPLLVAVTVLTSLTDADLRELGLDCGAAAQVERLARLARDCGADGVVASPLEVVRVRAACGPDFRLVTPGVRPAGASLDDQARVATPAQAIANGADWLVIGRPITRAPDPARALADILASL